MSGCNNNCSCNKPKEEKAEFVKCLECEYKHTYEQIIDYEGFWTFNKKPIYAIAAYCKKDPEHYYLGLIDSKKYIHHGCFSGKR